MQLGFDRYNAVSTVQKLESDDKTRLNVWKSKQHSSLLHRPTKLLKENILNKTFRYDKTSCGKINFENALHRGHEQTNTINKKSRRAG